MTVSSMMSVQLVASKQSEDGQKVQSGATNRDRVIYYLKPSVLFSLASCFLWHQVDIRLWR